MVAPRDRSVDGPTIFYAGAYWYRPNLDAAHVLIDGVFPRLRKLCPTARLLLIGASPSAEMEAAARSDKHIVVAGQVDDVRPYLSESDIVAVPLRDGGGIRSKILEAFAAGVPVVSTTKGAEGINVIEGRDLLIRDGATAFAAGIKELWDDPQRARSMADRAFELVRRDYSMETMEADVRAELRELRAARVARGRAR